MKISYINDIISYKWIMELQYKYIRIVYYRTYLKFSLNIIKICLIIHLFIINLIVI